ncbi:nuclear transport factor 2 family protein [Pelagibius sp.]|uniref:nuclear transport factor 2 family protein n=1 Tax=Pelagibius sp. TaxID=1931238 RepID=UPI002628A762|nr:nuclear transport factor 2 family protein [Pelagibius sp.]
MQEHADVLFANDTFYFAFQMRDLEAMDRLWSERTAVACIHPGWPAIAGREEVMQSWAAILSNEQAPAITCRGARAYRTGESAFVTCYELIGSNLLVATNVFIREGTDWKMVHHQAGPCNAPPGELPEEEPGSVQ